MHKLKLRFNKTRLYLLKTTKVSILIIYSSAYQGGDITGNYTPIVLDLIDNPTTESNPGNNAWDAANGEGVTGYTIKQIEDALEGKRTLNSWKDNIISKYDNATESNVGDVFNHWW